jgi:Cu+-exporting ATPase
MTKKIKLTIEGLHCASCAANAEKALKKVRGVNSASVSVMTKKAIIEAEDNINQDDLKKAVSNIGYKVIDDN